MVPPCLSIKMDRSKFLRNWLPRLILISSLSAIYLRTLAPGLSWANDGSDGGDLISAAATGGVPHPTGYPLYLLLAWLFQRLPVGSLALRTNLMSAVAAVLAAILIYEIVTGARSAASSQPRWPAGMAAAYTFGLAPLVWSQAVITEVYALQAFLTALILYLYTKSPHSSVTVQKRLDGWRGLALGLAMGNHVTTVLLVPAAFLLGSLNRRVQLDGSVDSKHFWFRNVKLDRGKLLRQLTMFGAGLSVYLILPLRALSNPPVNWGNAVTSSRFWWLVSGQIYQSYYLQFHLAEFWEHIPVLAGLLIKQFGLPGLALGLIGLVVFGVRSRLYALTAWTAVVSLLFAIFYGSNDFYVYLIPLLISFAIWVGLGMEDLIRPLFRRLPILGLGLGVILIAYFVGRSVTNLSGVDASHDQRAELFGRQVLSSAPENAIVFANGDRAVFALWYFHFALRERPDLTMVAVDLLHFDWYQENLRAIYPSLMVTGPFPWPETILSDNQGRPFCYVQYSEHASMDCQQAGGEDAKSQAFIAK